jgi:hypothetical protein
MLSEQSRRSTDCRASTTCQGMALGPAAVRHSKLPALNEPSCGPLRSYCPPFSRPRLTVGNRGHTASHALPHRKLPALSQPSCGPRCSPPLRPPFKQAQPDCWLLGHTSPYALYDRTLPALSWPSCVPRCSWLPCWRRISPCYWRSTCQCWCRRVLSGNATGLQHGECLCHATRGRRTHFPTSWQW